mgnify:CR=1 FL=1
MKIVVLGAGIIGIATAWYLLANGFRKLALITTPTNSRSAGGALAHGAAVQQEALVRVEEIGATIELVSVDATQWIATKFTGEWTVT